MTTFATFPDGKAIPALSGKGMYIYTCDKVVSAFNHNERDAAQAMKDMGLQHVWVRIHGNGYVGDRDGADRKKMHLFLDAVQTAGLAVAGWGWCQGENPGKEASLTKKALKEFGLDTFVADIEQGVSSSNWTPTEIHDYLAGVKDTASGGLALTSHGFIDWHDPAVLKPAEDFVDAMNPQAYWYGSFPSQKMVNAISKPAAYELKNSADYGRLCVDRYTTWYHKPVILTGQAYPEDAFSADDVEKKLVEFQQGFDAWGSIVALNFWHLGATTPDMRTTIAAI
ncbi:hypothetical protein B0G80_2044 [Paraburkholderia sp. BL6669N2]|uniref:hypothetical protein n=1 Tax=Paraburkholderia sp. BL6669N2 TaxID=1938807 RepID=UPI000E255F65|nr:hypothetical protein [Paraburkholderia sp. BL6669N2]REG59308.1 hypothetical protein B0G80_2044 [Paraburkholderia sp. BL6669N2]